MQDLRLIDMARYARVPIELNLEPNDRVVLITDRQMDPLVWQAFLIAARQLGADPTLVMIPPLRFPHDNPNAIAAAAMNEADLILAVTSHAFTHSQVAVDAMAQGKRYLMLEELKPEHLVTGGATADYHAMQKVAERIEAMLANARTVRITTDRGMDLTASIEGRPAFSTVGVARGRGVKLRAGGFPDGVIHLCPVEGTGEGRVVVDVSIHGIGALKEPVSFDVRGGRVVSRFSGGAEAQRLQELFEREGDADCWNCPAQMGFGINPQALSRGNVREEKKKLGHAGIAIGANWDLGGTVKSRLHVDCMARGATIEAQAIV